MQEHTYDHAEVLDQLNELKTEMNFPERGYYPPALQKLIPAKWIADEYINRTIHGRLDFEVMAHAMRLKQNILVTGSTQIGKTQMFRAFAAFFQIPFLVMTPGGSADASQFFGKDTITYNENGQMRMRWVDGIVTLAARYGHCVLLWDEANTSPPSIFATLHQLAGDERTLTLYDHVIPFDDPVYDHEGNPVLNDDGTTMTEERGAPEVIRANDNLLIGIAINPVELGYAGTDELSQALIERCDINFDMKQDVEIVDRLVGSATLKQIGVALLDQHETGDLRTPCSIRKLMNFETMVEDYGLRFAIDNMIAQFAASDRDVVKNMFDLNSENLVNEYRLIEGADLDGVLMD